MQEIVTKQRILQNKVEPPARQGRGVILLLNFVFLGATVPRMKFRCPVAFIRQEKTISF